MNDEQNKDFEEMQKSLKELEDIISKTNFSDIKDINNNITKVYAIYEKFPESEEIASEYVMTLDALAKSQESLVDLKAIVAKASGTYEKFPESEVVASVYVYTLSILARVQDSLADVKPMVAEASGIYEKFSESEFVAAAYVLTLNTLARIQDSLADVKAMVAEAFGIYEKFPKLEDIASLYLNTLYTLASRLESLADVKAVVDEASGIYKKFSESEVVASAYVLTLSTLARVQDSLDDVKPMVDEAFGIYEKFPESEEIASAYVLTLSILARTQDSLADVKATVDKAFDIYENFSDSERIASAYVLTLSTLARTQNSSLADVKATVDKAFDIYEKFPYSDVVVYIYANALVYLEIRQDTKQDLMKTFDKLIEIYEKFPSKANIRNSLADLISEDIIGNIFYSNDNLDSFNSDIVPVIKKMFNAIIELDDLKLPRYAPLIELLKDLEDCYREQLIKIYWIVQKIKYQLSVKDLSKKEFGHYTSGDVLQIFLKQSKDSKDRKEEYSIREHSRLCNVKYMNDPQEGTILDKYLGISESDNLEDSLKPSPWFLMSLTTKIDNLSMWSQYGASAEGVCLVLKTDSFKVYESMSETEWMGKYAILERKLTSIKYEETNSSYKKDYLYRICYLDEESLIKGDLNVVKESNNNLLDDEEITSIERSLGELKGILNNIKENASLYSTIDKCLEEIRYLFKVSDYSYESELRILKYAELDPGNKDIKIDDKSGLVAKLYLERDMPIQLEQVIFGPKFSNPEHVTPLLHLLDKNIELKRSKIKFK